MKCNNCSHNNESGAKFCTKCGANLNAIDYTEQEGSVDRYFKDKKHSLIEEAEALADDEMKQGVIWFVVALAITGGTWLFASEGGTYYVFWGAMIYSIYRLIRGFWYKMNPESLLEKAEKESEKESQK
jgi:hypothetical protein